MPAKPIINERLAAQTVRRLRRHVPPRSGFFAAFLLLAGTIGIPPSFANEPTLIASTGEAGSQIAWALVYAVLVIVLANDWERTRRTIHIAKLPLLVSAIPLISTVWSVAPGFTFRRGFAFFLTTLVGIYIAQTHSMRRQLVLLSWVLGIFAVANFITSLAFPGIGLMNEANIGAWKGLTSHKNTLGIICDLNCIVFLVTRKFVRRGRGLLVALTVLSVITAVESQSATSIVILCAFLVILPLYKVILRNLKRLTIAIAIVLILLCVIGEVLWTHLDILLEALGRDATLTGRTGIWFVALQGILDRPLLGYGYEAYWPTIGSFEAARLIKFPAVHAHNGYLQAMLDVGVIGLLCYLIMYGVLMRRVLRWSFSADRRIREWPTYFLLFGLMFNLSLPGFMTRNWLFWMLFVSIYCTVALEMERIERVRCKMVACPSRGQLVRTPQRVEKARTIECPNES